MIAWLTWTLITDRRRNTYLLTHYRVQSEVALLSPGQGTKSAQKYCNKKENHSIKIILPVNYISKIYGMRVLHNLAQFGQFFVHLQATYLIFFCKLILMPHRCQLITAGVDNSRHWSSPFYCYLNGCRNHSVNGWWTMKNESRYVIPFIIWNPVIVTVSTESQTSDVLEIQIILSIGT